jgi:hypothetical protein
MPSHPRPSRPRVDADGVRIIEGSRARKRVWLGLSLALLGVVAAVGVRVARSGRSEGPPPAVGARSAPGAVRPGGTRPAAPAPAPAARPVEPPRALRAKRPAPPAAATEPGELRASDVIPALRAMGEQGGIAAFPLPGTKPIKRGIVVPEGFELPEGYVRHYQTTDDGRQLPPILMFHPDYEGVDARGEPVPLPEDRVVPPEMAPPGLPIRILEIPEGVPGAGP